MIYTILKDIGLPVVYSHFKEQVKAPFLVYLGNGQDQFSADDITYHKRNLYQVEYYFTKKDESLEDEIETALLDAGYRYDKSEDTYIEDEDVYVIYYSVN